MTRTQQSDRAHEDAQEFDRRPCLKCDRAIGYAPSVTRAGYLYHSECADGMCHFCGEALHDYDETADPRREPFRFLDMGDVAHLECCQEAAWDLDPVYGLRVR